MSTAECYQVFPQQVKSSCPLSSEQASRTTSGQDLAGVENESPRSGKRQPPAVNMAPRENGSHRFARAQAEVRVLYLPSTSPPSLEPGLIPDCVVYCSVFAVLSGGPFSRRAMHLFSFGAGHVSCLGPILVDSSFQ